MNTIPTPHPSWCDETECFTCHGGQVVHRAGGEAFLDEGVTIDGIAIVRLVDRGNGTEVQLQPAGPSWLPR